MVKDLLSFDSGMREDSQVKNNRCNHLFGFSRLVIPVLLVVILALGIGLARYWQPARCVKRQQATLIDAVESRKAARIRRLVSNQYSDRWGFSAEDITNTILDCGSQFIALSVEPEEETLSIAGKTAIVSSRIVFRGTTLGPGAGEVMRRINRLEEPFVFTWQKQSFLPSSWRLVSLENESIPDDAWGYQPGSLRERFRNF